MQTGRTSERIAERGSGQARDLGDPLPLTGAAVGSGRWRRGLQALTGGRCLYCGSQAQTIDHIHPLSRGGLSATSNCVPACLACNGSKGDHEAWQWYRSQACYDPRRAMALRAWSEGDLRLAARLLTWVTPAAPLPPAPARPAHQTRQASTPLWRWQMAS